MNETFPAHATENANQAMASESSRIALDARRPTVLDQREHVLKVEFGHVDVFAMSLAEGQAEGARHHLFRVESGGLLLSLSDRPLAGSRTQIIAVGSAGAEVTVIPRTQFQSFDLIAGWISQLAQLIAGPFPNWEMREVTEAGEMEMQPGERRRGPVRNIIWACVKDGTAKVMGLDPPLAADSPPLPLTSGMWIEAGQSSCHVVGSTSLSGPDEVWRAIDQFHQCIGTCLHDHLLRGREQEAQRLVRRSELTTTQTFESFDRLSSIMEQRSDQIEIETHSSDPLLAACQIVANELHAPFNAPSRSSSDRQDFNDILRIARSARLRVRQTLLRGSWWKHDAGPLVAWHGEQRDPVALIHAKGRYGMIDAKTGARRLVDQSLALELGTEAAAFYPALPSRPLTFRDLLMFSIRQSSGNFARIALAVIVMALLSLVAPLITETLINSVIPRTELDQLLFCAFALAVAAIAGAGMQTMEGMAMLRLEGLIDWKLQAAVIDRMLRLPASLFRDYTVGELVGRSMGIDAARRIFTGHVLRGVLSGLFCWISIGLMFYYDSGLALIALLMTVLRAFMIIFSSLVRLHYETKLFDLQGKISGFVLQLISGIGKLRVAAATTRALAVWSRQFVVQRQHFISSQQTANLLGIFETSFPSIATLIVFAVAASTKSELFHNVGGFLAFFTAFGQSMASVGGWAAGLSAALVAIPHLTRLKPLISGDAEVSEDRKPPGELSGSVELSRLTFRYVTGGPPILDNVSLKIRPGEYVAIVGPSGSGKSSLFRLLLGFERAESGTVFFDGKAIDTLDISALRRQFGVVLQNGTLATGSIYENICGGVQLPLEQAWEAAQLAGLDADIKSMPMGMHTVVAEGVSTLSGGQRQRIMIARAVARRPRILLFDEATSALDNQSQAIVSTTLGNLNVTRVIIAHRLSTVRQVDRIIVLADGKIVQSGSFAELSNTPGMFASFAQRQLL